MGAALSQELGRLLEAIDCRRLPPGAWPTLKQVVQDKLSSLRNRQQSIARGANASNAARHAVKANAVRLAVGLGAPHGAFIRSDWSAERVRQKIRARPRAYGVARAPSRKFIGRVLNELSEK